MSFWSIDVLICKWGSQYHGHGILKELDFLFLPFFFFFKRASHGRGSPHL